MMNRRKFLKSGIAIPLGVSITSLHSNAFESLQNRDRSDGVGAKIKISLNAYSFNSELRSFMNGEPGGMSLFDVLEYCARVGFDAVEPTGYYFPGYPDPPERSFLTANPYNDIDKVIPYAVNWQLKNLLKNRQGGPIDVVRFTRLLLKHNYRGYVPIEALPGPAGRDNFNPHQQVEKLFKLFRNAILAQQGASPSLI